jgi:hypothetical protein
MEDRFASQGLELPKRRKAGATEARTRWTLPLYGVAEFVYSCRRPSVEHPPRLQGGAAGVDQDPLVDHHPEPGPASVILITFNSNSASRSQGRVK